MCGGSGTRLWPASREAMPKQFIRLLKERSSFQETLLRVADGALFAPPVVVTARPYGFMVADQAGAQGASPTILLEPVRRDSGPAIAAGTAFIAASEPEALVLVLAADHEVKDPEGFRQAVRRAAPAAAAGHIVTFGATPDRPATGYGYIRKGEPLPQAGLFRVDAFVEKPDEDRARAYVADGYLWNSGNFLFRADVLLAEYARHDADTVRLASEAVEKGGDDLGRLTLDEAAFRGARALSIDRAVMERTDRAAVMPIEVGWSDIGSWGAVWEAADKDEAGNAALGEAIFLEASDNLVSGRHLVCLSGVNGLAVIDTPDATLVFDRRDPEGVRRMVEALSASARPELTEHLEAYRPWGSYQSLDRGARFQVKRIVVKPGGKLSLQMHYHRAEHWIVVVGTALVTVDGKETILRENESIYIPLGAVHRLENPGKVPLELIEVQTGTYLGEDDIVRLDDAYRRG